MTCGNQVKSKKQIFNLKTFKFVTTLTRRVWQNVKYRVAELKKNLLKIFLNHFCNQRNWSEQERLSLRNIDKWLIDLLPSERKSVFPYLVLFLRVSIMKTLWCRAFLQFIELFELL